MAVDFEKNILDILSTLDEIPPSSRAAKVEAAINNIEIPKLRPSEVEDISDILASPTLQKAYDLLKGPKLGKKS